MVGLKRHPDICVYKGTKLGQKLCRIVKNLYYACLQSRLGKDEMLNFNIIFSSWLLLVGIINFF